jgi:hypothetical protein
MISRRNAVILQAGIISLSVLLSISTASAQTEPTAREQLMLEYTNRMRLDPQPELWEMVDQLDPIRSPDPDIDNALQYFDVDGNLLYDQWQQLSPAPPLAWHESLIRAARNHSQAMIDADDQQHQFLNEPGLVDRVEGEGYVSWNRLAENIYAYSDTVFYGHAGFTIDWGDDTGGIQNPPGHRDNIMNPDLREIGIGILSVTDPSKDVGPLVITQDFGSRFNSAYGNPRLLGVVYDDTDGDAFYSVGEGLGDVRIVATSGGSETETFSMSAGGYQTPLAAGIYDLLVYGGGLGGAALIETVTVDSDNVKVDVTPGDLTHEPGDLDLDGTVSFLEAARVVARIGLSNADWATGDVDASGVVDVGDADQAVAAYQPPASPSAIPEPGALTLLATGAVVATARIRRRRGSDRPV